MSEMSEKCQSLTINTKSEYLTVGDNTTDLLPEETKSVRIYLSVIFDKKQTSTTERSEWEYERSEQLENAFSTLEQICQERD